MRNRLERGQRLPLTQVLSGTRLTLAARLPGMIGADVSLFGLDAERKLCDDRYFIFYNQLTSPEGALQLEPSSNRFTVDLERVPLGIHRLLLAATSEETPFSDLTSGTVSMTDEQGGEAAFELPCGLFSTEQAIMLVEIYRHQGQWRLSAVGQGFSGGLAALLQSFGGKALEDSAAATSGEASPDWKTSLANLTLIFGQPAPFRPEVWLPLESAPLDPWQYQDSCKRCGRKPGLGAKLSAQKVCKSCAQEVAAGLQNFRTRFLAACADGVMEQREWEDLQQTVYRERLSARAALEFVRADSLDLLERTVSIAQADGAVSEQEKEVFERLVGLLNMPEGMVRTLRARVAELCVATELRAGKLPRINSTLILDAGEVAHLETEATFRHVTATRTRDIPGRAVLTNRQMHFVSSAEGGWSVQYSKVLRIEPRPDGVNLELGVKRGSGSYRAVAQPIILAATLETLTRLHKRLLLLPQGEKASRSISQKVKVEVWQRDQGRCVQCSDTNYLEFDHVIPHSLGGATSAGNLQLLCRRCNLIKSDRL